MIDMRNPSFSNYASFALPQIANFTTSFIYSVLHASSKFRKLRKLQFQELFYMPFNKSTLAQTLILGVFFLLLVTTYVSFSNIIAFIFQNDSKQYPFTGTLSLILNYLVYLIGLTWAASLTNYKRQFQIAAICYTINYALYLLDFNQLLRLIISILGALIGGYGASVLFVSQGGYLVKLFKMKGIQQVNEGMYIGVFNGILFSQIAFGGVLTTFALGLFGKKVYFTILTFISILSFFLCRLKLDPLEDPSSINQKYHQQQISFLHELQKVLKYYPSMKYIIVATILDGFFTAFIATNFSQFLSKPLKSTFNVGLLHISNGIGAIIGGYLSGYLSDKISPFNEGIVLFSFTSIVLLITTLNTLIFVETIDFPLFLAFLWGISFSFLQGWLFVCCVKINKGKNESFAIVKQMHTLFFIIFQIYSMASSKINFLATIILFLSLSIISGVICFVLQRRNSSFQDNQLVEIEIGQDQS